MGTVILDVLAGAGTVTVLIAGVGALFVPMLLILAIVDSIIGRRHR